MAISATIQNIPDEPRQTLVAAYQSMELGRPLTLTKSILVNAMAAVGCNDTPREFLSDLQDKREQRAPKDETKHGRRVAAVLVFVPYETIPNGFLDVDFEAAVRASQQSRTEEEFREYTREIILALREKVEAELKNPPRENNNGDENNKRRIGADVVEAAKGSKRHKPLAAHGPQEEHQPEGRATAAEPSHLTLGDRVDQSIKTTPDENGAKQPYDQADAHEEVTEDNNENKQVTSAGTDKAHAISHPSKEPALDYPVLRNSGSHVSDKDASNDNITANNDKGETVDPTLEDNGDDKNNPISEGSTTLFEKLCNFARGLSNKLKGT